MLETVVTEAIIAIVEEDIRLQIVVISFKEGTCRFYYKYPFLFVSQSFDKACNYTFANIDESLFSF